MTYFTAPNEGAVFCTGSIGYGQSLPVNNFQNNTSTILKNVVNAFSKEKKTTWWFMDFRGKTMEIIRI